MSPAEIKVIPVPALTAATLNGKLPTRQRQVMEGMWAGKCTKEIALDLGISAKTVEFHRMVLYQRFGVTNPVTLCRRGLAVGEIRL